jgi:hypothetical protein
VVKALGNFPIEVEEAETLMRLAFEEAVNDFEKTEEQVQNELESSVEGWVDETEALTGSQREQLARDVLPVRLTIAKVSSIYTIHDTIHN